MDSRLDEWEVFSSITHSHIKNYTIPQYGDKPGDNLSTWDPEDCIRQIGKYINRFKNNARGPYERKLDMLKVAHYACVAFWKLQEQEDQDADESN